MDFHDLCRSAYYGVLIIKAVAVAAGAFVVVFEWPQ